MVVAATEPTIFAAADAHRDEPFIFHRGEVTEPLRKKLVAAYKRAGKDFLLCENDWSGVYPKETWWLIPKGVSPSWVRRHLADLIATTDLFPAAQQGNVFFHSGDLGDIIAALPTIRQLGGGKLVIGHQPGVGNREAMKGARFDAIRPLLEAQPYITEVEYDDHPTNVTHNLALFRNTGIRYGESLAHWQARYCGITNLDVSPWLEVGHFEPNGRVVINRSARYHNMFFPWGELAYRHREGAFFVGLQSEHAEFEKKYRTGIRYLHTPDLLELAKWIAGCKLFIGNQSAPFWIAAGLGVPLIQETIGHDPNSIIERENAIYTRTGPETRTLMHRLKKGLSTQLNESLV